MHSEYLQELQNLTLSIFYAMDEKSVAGVSFIRFGIDDIMNTLDLIDADGNIRYDRISNFLLRL